MSNSLIPIIALSKREIIRFLKVYHQTILAPIVTAIMYLMVFYFVMNKQVSVVGNTSYINFIASGIIMMTIIQNSFANTSSVIVMGKVTGTIIDYILPPFSPFELITALITGGITRGIIIAIFLIAILSLYVNFEFHNFSLMLFYIFSATIFFSIVGILCGLVSNSFDQISAITSYFITPFTFLSGTFYSIHNLPELFINIAHINPFFYFIDGFRFSMTGHCEYDIQTGIIFICILTSIIFTITYKILEYGWRIRH